jgi:hypothetical protein
MDTGSELLTSLVAKNIVKSFRCDIPEKVSNSNLGKMASIETDNFPNSTWDRCYDFKNIFAEKFSKKNGVFDSKQS